MEMIKFIENTHKYVDMGGDVDWKSVTSLIHDYIPKKDWDKIAERYAKKHKLTSQEVKDKWKKENDISLERGTKFHKQREEDLLSCGTVEGLSIYQPSIDDDGYKIAPSQKLNEGVYPELLVYLNSAGICGQADYVEIRNGMINIKDWKTNKEIKMNGYVNWEGVEERLLPPISSIPNSNYWTYALQLNTYAYIIRKNNPLLKIGKLELLHIQFDNEGEVSNIQPYILPDLQSVVKSMIDHYKNKK